MAVAVSALARKGQWKYPQEYWGLENAFHWVTVGDACAAIMAGDYDFGLGMRVGE